MTVYIYSTHEHEVSSDAGYSDDTIYVAVDAENVKLRTENAHLLGLTWGAWRELVAKVEASHKELSR